MNGLLKAKHESTDWFIQILPGEIQRLLLQQAIIKSTTAKMLYELL